METFSALLAFCAGNSPVPGEFPTERPVTRSFDVFFDLRLNKRLSKQSESWWFETLSRPLWRHRNAKKSSAKCRPFWSGHQYHWTIITMTSRERHIRANHRQLDYLFNDLFELTTMMISKLRSRWVPLRKNQWCVALMFSLVLTWTSLWTISLACRLFESRDGHVTSLLFHVMLSSWFTVVSSRRQKWFHWFILTAPHVYVEVSFDGCQAPLLCCSNLISRTSMYISVKYYTYFTMIILKLF